MTAEYPALTDVEQIKIHLGAIDRELRGIGATTGQADIGLAECEARLAQVVQAVNLIGSQVQWLVDNLQGIFGMLGSPQFQAQLLGTMTGQLPGMMEGMLNGGQPASAAADGRPSAAAES